MPRINPNLNLVRHLQRLEARVTKLEKLLEGSESPSEGRGATLGAPSPENASEGPSRPGNGPSEVLPAAPVWPWVPEGCVCNNYTWAPELGSPDAEGHHPNCPTRRPLGPLYPGHHEV